MGALSLSHSTLCLCLSISLSLSLRVHPPQLCTMSKGQVPQLAAAMLLMIDTFDKYAKKDGDGESLSKGELSDLLKAELGDFTSSGDKAKVEQFFNQLDENKDGTISFQEFMVFTASLTMMIQGMSKKM